MPSKESAIAQQGGMVVLVTMAYGLSTRASIDIVLGSEDGPILGPMGVLTRLRDVLTNSLSILPHFGMPGNPTK